MEEGDRVGVGGVDADGVTPPCGERRRADRAVLGVLEREEDKDDRDRDTCVQTGGQDVWRGRDMSDVSSLDTT